MNSLDNIFTENKLFTVYAVNRIIYVACFVLEGCVDIYVCFAEERYVNILFYSKTHNINISAKSIRNIGFHHM